MKTLLILLVGLVLGAGGLVATYLLNVEKTPTAAAPPGRDRQFRPRKEVDPKTYSIPRILPSWKDPTSLEEIRKASFHVAQRNLDLVDEELRRGFSFEDEPGRAESERVKALLFKHSMHMMAGDPDRAYAVLGEARRLAEASPRAGDDWLYTVIFHQAVAALRKGENENCIDCRGAGACIFPLARTAIHKLPDGSRTAIKHFTEYIQKFPDDLGVRWLLNLAYMTLGEYPDKVPPEYLLTFEKFGRDDDIGRFEEISHRVGMNRVSVSGGAVMDDFDNDGYLDLVISCFDPAQQSMAFYRNKGDGTFEDRTRGSGLEKQFGGFDVVQGDYNNDGYLDLFVPHGSWLVLKQRPSLLRNNGNGTFTDVTREAGLLVPANSPAAAWGDFDNDGHLDLFVCCGDDPNLLFRNKGDGTFEEVAKRAGVQGEGQECKGVNWIDYDNDGYPDLFLSYGARTPQLLHNNRDGTFTDVTRAMGIDGPLAGFACWAFDYDNDGWIDIFDTCYMRTLDDVVAGMLGQPPLTPTTDTTRLWRNLGGKGFKDVSHEVGVDKVFSTMGCNFGDLDNDGYLDIYLGTGEPSFSMLVPNRMFRNQAGKRFAEITTTSGTGHLQKGHATSIGDWDRDGNVDLFVETGGAVYGDRYHNLLFQNPGQGNHWLNLKLVGKKTNRAALGARIKVVTAGEPPLTVHRHVTSGGSFGSNTLEQTIGLGKHDKVSTVEVYWPTSRTTQVFRDVPVDQFIEITEFASDYQRRNLKRIPVPRE